MIEILIMAGYATTIVVIVGIFISIVVWIKGILPALWRLGNGLAKRKVIIFAKGENVSSLEGLLADSSLFKKKNITSIESIDDLGIAEDKTLYLMHWHDWADNIDDILTKKSDGTALIIYAPQSLGFIPQDQMNKVNSHRNVIVVNLRGRLINDIIISLITTSYEKR